MAVGIETHLIHYSRHKAILVAIRMNDRVAYAISLKQCSEKDHKLEAI